MKMKTQTGNVEIVLRDGVASVNVKIPPDVFAERVAAFWASPDMDTMRAALNDLVAGAVGQGIVSAQLVADRAELEQLRIELARAQKRRGRRAESEPAPAPVNVVVHAHNYLPSSDVEVIRDNSGKVTTLRRVPNEDEPVANTESGTA